MLFLVQVVTFLGQLYFMRIYFFSINTSAEQLLFQSNQFKTIVTFLEQVLLHSSYFFGGDTFSELLLLLAQLSFQNSYPIRSKLVPTRYFLRISSSIRELVFQYSYHLGRQICSEYRYLKRSFFFEAGTSTKHQIFQNSCFFNKVTSSKETLFQNNFFFSSATFGNSYFFREKIERKIYFFSSLHLRQNFDILKTSIKIQFNYLFCFS